MSPASSFLVSPLLFCCPFLLISMPTANVLPTSLLCVLSDSGATLATPLGPTWQYVPPVVPPLSFFSAFLLLSSSPLFSSSSSSSLMSVFASIYSSHLSAEVTPFHHHGQSDPPTYTVYTGHFMKSQIVTLHVAHKFTYPSNTPIPGLQCSSPVYLGYVKHSVLLFSHLLQLYSTTLW